MSFRAQQTGIPSHSGMSRASINPPRNESEESFLDRIKATSSKTEDFLDDLSDPIKPYLPALGRFLIVVTFFEDALRIVTQWSDQTYYLSRVMGLHWTLTSAFLIANVIVMVSGSVLVIAQKHIEFATGGLIGVVVSQAFAYGLYLDVTFLFRVIGGLLMVLSDSLLRSSKSKAREIFANLPTASLSPHDRHKYILLAGRILLIFLFVGFAFHGEWSFFRVLISMIGLATCVMVAIGFKAKWSAMFLVLALSIFNIFINNWWSLHFNAPARDFLKYDFFQTLSIVGGLLLLVNIGPGNLSMDEKKKIY